MYISIYDMYTHDLDRNDTTAENNLVSSKHVSHSLSYVILVGLWCNVEIPLG